MAVRFCDIIGFPGYRIGDDGSVWSRRDRYGRGITETWNQLKPTADSSGHLRVGLRANGRRYVWRVHRLVLEAFVGPCPPGMEACHFPNRNPADNRLCNLRWDTPQANTGDAMQHGTHRIWLPGVDHHHAKLDDEKVRAIRTIPQSSRRKGWITETAKLYGVTRKVIKLVVDGVTWKHVI